MADMTAADIAAVTNHGYGYGCNDGWGFGGGNGLWLFAILALMSGGFGGWSGNRGNVATTEDLASGFNFSGVNNKLNEITAGIAGVNQNLSNAICQLGYQGAQHTYELGSKIDNCCCTTQRAIDSVKFDMANYAAGINANVTAQVQSVKDMLAAEKAAAQAARIQQLELQQALCGVVRYPMAATYNAGYPFNYGCGCGCGNI